MSNQVTDIEALGNRVRSNEEWYDRCGVLYCEEMRRNGAYARSARESRGLSLRSVAKKMGVSAMFLSDLERGNRNWHSGHVEKWKAALEDRKERP